MFDFIKLCSRGIYTYIVTLLTYCLLNIYAGTHIFSFQGDGEYE